MRETRTRSPDSGTAAHDRRDGASDPSLSHHFPPGHRSPPQPCNSLIFRKGEARPRLSFDHPDLETAATVDRIPFLIRRRT